ncbi:NADPH-dependent assimilatory sulfite reductase hemoprotein subunit [Fontisphaera persica]|uniref:NADPH-dependent assimilatory sulfite reductase hemoprotein subunit n=1 Tax=Fontisphaera persica TaxID=2974023 RepID=UPI0024C0DA8D|nr:NADPH-dependent assimilatory sulfite reductase hemoprotein subunit [Fontisphaera persica]WCJ57909.1 NADPH-dependent assimilatory sulfite reductase hemoprotein subunit [Fontisphaera persica]
METNVAEAKVSPNELLKAGCPTLAGTLAQTLADEQADHFSEEDAQFLKFHGCYQQDDRDVRKQGKKFIMMVRVRMPGGVLKPAQYVAMDRLASEYGNDTLRVTSRQGIQFHGVLKSGLARTIRGINEALLTTLAACGDVVRNVVTPPPVLHGLAGQQVLADARLLSQSLLPQTPAYHEIWLNGERLKLESEVAGDFVDPLYGKTYLPRKFKISFAIPPVNDVDIFAQCLGFIAIQEDGQVAGYNVVAGGGMGRSHGNQQTFPRLGDLIGYIPRGAVEAAARAVVGIHRDYGDRANRKHARLKYVLADRGVDWFRAELEQRLGFKLEAARPFVFTRQGDWYGWRQLADGTWVLGMFIETGRIRDTESRRLKTALRRVVEELGLEVHLTPANNLLLVGIQEGQRAEVTRILAEHGADPGRAVSAVRGASMACVALPTCGLALAEAERYLPNLMTEIEQALQETGLGGEEIIIRMTGCPNGCARPYMAEIALVGKAPGRYQLFVGGNAAGTRLNRVYKETVKEGEIIGELRALFERFRRERVAHERFGDWAARVLWLEAAA